MNKAQWCMIAGILFLIPMWADAQIQKTTKTTKVDYSVETEHLSYAPAYDHRINFGFPRLGYEHIQPDAVYFGIEGWRVYRIGHRDFQRDIGEGEVRLGYNFLFDNRDHFTPIIGGGYFKDFKYHRRNQAIGYGTIGFLFDHEFGSVFNLGLNLKGLLGYTVGKNLHVKHHHPGWGNPIWGYDIGVPLTFRFSHQRHWDVRLEPFYIQMFAHHGTHNFGGFRGSLGYRF